VVHGRGKEKERGGGGGREPHEFILPKHTIKLCVANHVQLQGVVKTGGKGKEGEERRKRDVFCGHLPLRL